MKLKHLNLLVLLILISSCKPTLDIQGKKLKAIDVCDKCKPGNYGPVMLMTKNTYEPNVEDNSTPLTIAHSILGHVFPAKNMDGNLAIPCSNTTENPFDIKEITNLGSTGSKGTSIGYTEKELLQINVSATVSTDIASIKAANPSISLSDLEAFKAKLTAAYSRFANKELNIEGKYFHYALHQNAVLEIARKLNYSECRASIYNPTNPKRLITAIGLVYFDINYSSKSVDEIASSLQADAKAYGITFNVSAEFKKNISKELEKVTDGYFQIVVWRTVGISEINKLE